MAVTDQTIRLFVSSTFFDFTYERDLLQRDVFPRIRDLCRAEGFRFQPVDLRWGVSDRAEADALTQSICFDEIRRCQDVSPHLNLLILLGDRYGTRLLPERVPATHYDRLMAVLDRQARQIMERIYLPDINALEPAYVLRSHVGERETFRHEVAETLLRALTRACGRAGFSPEESLPYTGSITHQEIQRALLDAGCDPSAVLCAFRSFLPKAEGRNAGPYAKLYIEQDPDARDRLAALRRAISAKLGHRVLEYELFWTKGIGPWTIRDVLQDKLYRLLEGRVREIIAERNKAGRATRLSAANGQYIAQHTQSFTGREVVMDTISRHVATAVEGKPCAPLVIVGDSGAGKSAVLAEACRRMSDVHPQAVVISRFIGITPATSAQRELLRGIWREVIEAYGGFTMEVPADEAQLVSRFPDVLRLASRDTPLILVFDGLDRLGAQPQRVDWLPDSLPAHVAVLISIRSGREEIETLRKRFTTSMITALGALSRDEAGRLLDRWLARDGRRLQPRQRDAVLDAYTATGSPLHLRGLYETARRWRFDGEPEDQLPATLPALFGSYLAQLADPRNHGRALVSHALSYIAASRHGLGEDELLDVLAKDTGVRDGLRAQSAQDWPEVDSDLPLPYVLWGRLHADLQGFVTEHEADGATLLTFHYDILQRVVAERYLSGSEAEQRHRVLAAYFGSQSLGTTDAPNQRMLIELTYHQATGHLESALLQTLTDAQFLQAKIALGGAQAALADLALASPTEAVRRISRAIRAGAHVIERKPDEFANQLQGREDAAALLHNLAPSESPHFRLLSQSLMPLDPALDRVFTGHTSLITCCSFDADGMTIVSGSGDQSTRTWDRGTGQAMRTWVYARDDVPYYSVPRTFALSPDGHRALGASDPGTAAHLYAARTGALFHSMLGHEGVVTCGAFSGDGRRCVTGAGDRMLRVWNTETGELVETLGPHPKPLEACALSADGSLAAGVSDWQLFVWDVSKALPHPHFNGIGSGVKACAFRPAGRQVLAGCYDHTLKLWDIESGECARTFTGHRGAVNCCGFDSTGRLAVSGSNDETVRVWDVVSGDALRLLVGHVQNVTACALDASGRYVLSGSWDGSLRLWDLSREQSSVTTREPAISASDFDAGGRLAFTLSRGERGAKIWDVATQRRVNAFGDEGVRASAGAISPSGAIVATAHFGGTIRLWNSRTGQETRQFEFHADAGPDAESESGWVNACAFDGEDHLLVTAMSDHTLRVWDVLRGEQLRVLRGHDDAVMCCAISRDGRYALSGGGSDNTFRIWHLDGSGDSQKLETEQMALACCFSPDGQMAYTMGSANTFCSWEVATGRKLSEPAQLHWDSSTWDKRLDGTWRSMAVSADGRLVLLAAECAAGSYLSLRDIETWQEVCAWLHDMPLHSCAFSPDGKLVIAGDEFGSLHFLAVDGVEPFLLTSAVALSQELPRELVAPAEDPELYRDKQNALEGSRSVREERPTHRPAAGPARFPLDLLRRVFGIRKPVRDTPSVASDPTPEIVWRARDLYRHGSYAEALPLLERAVREAPLNVHAWHYLSEVLRELGRKADADNAFEKATTLDPEGPYALASRALILGALNAADLGMDVYDRLLAVQVGGGYDVVNINVWHATAWRRKGEIYLRRGQYDEALDAYNRVIGEGKGTVFDLNGKGKALLALGRNEEALVAFDRALSQNPRHTDSWYRKAAALERLDRHEEAVLAYDQVLALEPKTLHVRFYRGASLMALSRDPEALSNFEAELAMNPKDADVWEAKGALLLGQQRNEDALDALNRALALSPDSALALRWKAGALANLGRYDEAIGLFQQCLASNPDDAAAWALQAEVLERLGRYDDALASISRAHELGFDTAEGWTLQGHVFMELGRNEDALRAFRRALEHDPSAPEALTNEGKALYLLGRKEESLAVLRRALELAPSADAWLKVGALLHALARQREACEACEKALELDSTLKGALFIMGTALLQLGQPAEALKYLERALELDAGQVEVWRYKVDALNRLERYSDALGAIEHVLALDATRAQDWVAKSGVLLTLNDPASALPTAEQAIRLAPNNASAWGNKGMALRALGREAEAIAAERQAESLEEDNGSANSDTAQEPRPSA